MFVDFLNGSSGHFRILKSSPFINCNITSWCRKNITGTNMQLIYRVKKDKFEKGQWLRYGAETRAGKKFRTKQPNKDTEQKKGERPLRDIVFEHLQKRICERRTLVGEGQPKTGGRGLRSLWKKSPWVRQLPAAARAPSGSGQLGCWPVWLQVGKR